ncbi:ATPase, T2SS/T4P/T4SS family, partial [Klebsiella pneumoniae]|uniref:ATPase, T2SS/T4P/T4SS family n=1 Tax=Klebsiella pneumoniae TaxID=573 RepID=UPI002731B66A
GGEAPRETPTAGMNQTKINPRPGPIFHSVRRALLPQDPDFVMVGETRDAEPAKTAPKPPQPGHLVLPPLPTNPPSKPLTRLQ